MRKIYIKYFQNLVEMQNNTYIPLIDVKYIATPSKAADFPCMEMKDDNNGKAECVEGHKKLSEKKQGFMTRF